MGLSTIRRMRWLAILLCVAMMWARAAAESLFDPQRHMHVSEVQPGMKGYGLSVFSGSKIERFDVEVVSVLHNFNPKDDVVLIRCAGQNLEHTGAIAGMSGSPIYLFDAAGKARMIGAFAYGWPLVKDPLAGVQPIEYMLDIGSTLRTEPAATQPAGQFSKHLKNGLLELKCGRAVELSAGKASAAFTVRGLTEGSSQPQLLPLATPMMASGLSTTALERISPLFSGSRLVPLQAGAASQAASTQPVGVEPGSVLAAPMLTGDVELTALGTCTEVIGDRVFAFGHPFNNEGPITLPMASGYVNAVIPKLDQSFKLGAMDRVQGTLTADQQVGVAGRLGKAPPTIPIEMHVVYADGSLDQTYHFQAAAHPRLTAELIASALTSALSGQRDLPQYHTAEFSLDLEFANGKTIHIADRAVNDAETSVPLNAGLSVELAAENPFERVMLKRLRGTVTIEPEAHSADVLSVTLPKSKYRAGESVKVFVRYRPFRSGDQILPIELPLPKDLRDGSYQLSVGDLATFMMAEMAARPFRFDAESIDDTFAVLQDVASLRSDNLYLRLTRRADGVAIGRTALNRLPSSRRQLLIDSGRSNVSEFNSDVIKTVATNQVISGSADFTIQIDNGDHPQSTVKPAARPTSMPSNILRSAVPGVSLPKGE